MAGTTELCGARHKCLWRSSQTRFTRPTLPLVSSDSPFSVNRFSLCARMVCIFRRYHPIFFLFINIKWLKCYFLKISCKIFCSVKNLSLLCKVFPLFEMGRRKQREKSSSNRQLINLLTIKKKTKRDYQKQLNQLWRMLTERTKSVALCSTFYKIFWCCPLAWVVLPSALDDVDTPSLLGGYQKRLRRCSLQPSP